MAERVFKLADKLFQLPLEEKLKCEMDKWGDLRIGGYKPVGKHSGVLEGGKDGFENFFVPLNLVLGLAPGPPIWPSPVTSDIELLKEFELSCQAVTLSLFSGLSRTMPTARAIQFENLHRSQELSTLFLGMLKYLSSADLGVNEAEHMAHTDVGSLTLLFTSSPGLQVFHRTTSSWLPIAPRQKSIFVNVGDTLSFISRNTFNSCIHRVVPDAGLMSLNGTRFTLAFFLRPELSATFFDSNGRKWTGEEWHRAKYKIFRAENEVQRSSSLLTGVKGFLGEYKNIQLVGST